MEKYGKTNQQILDDIYDEVKKSHSNDKIYVFFNYFKDWLLVDHPDIVWFCGKNKCQKRAIKARHPHTVHTYMIIIRSIFEEIGNIEINSRLFNKRVKIPKAEEENPVFKEAVKLAITPMISSLALMENANSESKVLGIGISIIALNLGMYLGIPAIVIVGIRKKF